MLELNLMLVLTQFIFTAQMSTKHHLMEKNLVICHGDGDGLIGAAVAIKDFCLKMEETEIVITQPFLLDKVVVRDQVMAIFVIDIAVNNRDVDMTINFVRKYEDRIVSWIDHHQGTDVLENILGITLISGDKEPSCPSLMKNAGFVVSDDWLRTANACDRPTDFAPTELSKRYNKALKVSLIEAEEGNRIAIDQVQRAFLFELLDGEKWQLITDYGKRYQAILTATKKAAESFTELLPGVGIVLLGDEKVDKTVVCTEGYKKYPVVVIQFHSLKDGEPVTMVATNNKEVNLVNIFRLPSGPPFRVNLPGNLKKIKELIIDKLS